MSEESVTLWIARLKEGDDAAAEELWDRYFRRLVGLGRKVLRDSPKRMADEEDVALSAFKSLCLRARDDRFPKLDDRDDLWKLLVTITVRKASRAARRDGRAAINDQSFVQDQLADAAPTPEFALQMEDQIEALLGRLRDERLREVALGKLEGLTNDEIAAQMERSVSFVERKLQLIRQIWSSEEPS